MRKQKPSCMGFKPSETCVHGGVCSECEGCSQRWQSGALPMMQIARSFTEPVKGTWMRSSGSSSLLISAGAPKLRRSSQARNTPHALPAVASFKAYTCNK